MLGSYHEISISPYLRWMRFRDSENRDFTHFRILPTSYEDNVRRDEIRFNQRYTPNGGFSLGMGPWVSPLPSSFVRGNNEVVITIETETWRVAFNGVDIELVEAMPVKYQRFGEATKVFLEQTSDNMEFLDGGAILTPILQLGK